MTTVKISPKYQVVIPKQIREMLRLRPGTTLQVMQFDGRIELIPLQPIRNLRGMLKGMSSDVEREEEDRI